MISVRSRLLPLMTAFDFPDTTLPCSQRDVSNVAPQALALLNNGFVHEQSAALAERIAREAGGEPRRQVERAWLLALGRTPSEREANLAAAHLAEQEAHFRAPDAKGDSARLALASLCHVLVNTNEFMYVD
jgi:hypothetical protein